MLELDENNVNAVIPHTINIGGIKKQIASFEEIYTLEWNSENVIDFDMYSNMFFYNMGYLNRPTNDWYYDEETPIENMAKPIKIQLPHVVNTLIMHPQHMILSDIFECIYLWGRDKMRQGIQLSEEESFELPPIDEIRYKLQNNIAIDISAKILDNPSHWSCSNIWQERLHNLCPNIDKEYFNYCIQKFSRYIDQIIIDNPIPIFVSSMINPSIFYTIIRSCEIQSSKLISQQKFGGKNAHILKDEYKTKIFIPLLEKKLEILRAIYSKYGPRGIVEFAREENSSKKVIIPALDETTLQERAAQDRLAALVSSEEKRKFIEETECNEGNLGYVFNHLSKDTLPPQLIKSYPTLDDKGNTVNRVGSDYYSFLKRVFTIFKQLDIYYPEIIRSDNVWIVSQPFFLNEQAFGLYHKDEQLLLIAFPNISFTLTTPFEGIKIYKDRYGVDVYLDPKEIGDALNFQKTDLVVFDQEIPQEDKWKYRSPYNKDVI